MQLESTDATAAMPSARSPLSDAIDEDGPIKLLTVTETAEILRVSVQRVYELVRTKLIPSVRMGRQVRIDQGKLREWVESGGKSLDGGWKRST